MEGDWELEGNDEMCSNSPARQQLFVSRDVALRVTAEWQTGSRPRNRVPCCCHGDSHNDAMIGCYQCSG